MCQRDDKTRKISNFIKFQFTLGFFFPFLAAVVTRPTCDLRFITKKRPLLDLTLVFLCRYKKHFAF